MNNNASLNNLNLNNYQNNQQRTTNLNNPFPINNEINMTNQTLYTNISNRDKKIENYQNPFLELLLHSKWAKLKSNL